LSKVAGGSTAYTYDRADRILTAGATTITVDANGNTTAKGADTFGLKSPWGHQRRRDWRPRRVRGGFGPLAVPLLPSPAMEIMGVQIRTIIRDNVATRCDGCLEIIEGTPWRVNLLDIVASEAPVAWTDRPVINPGPFQFHGDPVCVRRWMAGKGYLFCRRGEVREIMRPVAIPGEASRWGLCDGIHRDDHEFVPA
jgi:hypothetical protein